MQKYYNVPMTQQELDTLKIIHTTGSFKIKTLLGDFIRNAKIEETQTKPTRTSSQNNALWLWFTQIEQEAENQGITWDLVIKHVHQLRVTKENLHSMCKDLQKALWGTTSTAEIKKTGQLDIIIDHFVDLFGKVGLELPPFPNNEANTVESLGGYKTNAGKSPVPYNDNYEEPTI